MTLCNKRGVSDRIHKAHFLLHRLRTSQIYTFFIFDYLEICSVLKSIKDVQERMLMRLEIDVPKVQGPKR